MKTTFRLIDELGQEAGSATYVGRQDIDGKTVATGLVEVILEDADGVSQYPSPRGFSSRMTDLHFVLGELQKYADRRGWELEVSGDPIPELELDPRVRY